MNECIHAGWTTGIPPGQELDGSVSHKKKKTRNKKPSHLILNLGGLTYGLRQQ